jgi:predicted kinase
VNVIIFTDLQASGKTTFYRKRDRRQLQLIEEALHNGRSVVVDNTNPTVDDRALILALARSYDARTVGLCFERVLGLQQGRLPRSRRAGCSA